MIVSVTALQGECASVHVSERLWRLKDGAPPRSCTLSARLGLQQLPGQMD
jgi:hypothetical protein